MSSPGSFGGFSLPVFRVYEHQRIRVGEQVSGLFFSAKQFASLVDLAEHTRHRYFTIGHRSIQFKQFVGILSTPLLTLEILPKADRRANTQEATWQRVLVDMLRQCRFVRPEQLGWSKQQTQSGTLLEWYVQAFFLELEALLRYGLIHQYTRQAANLNVLKGQLQFAQQIKHNSIRKDRFFVKFDRFTDQHPLNLLIGAALARLEKLSLPPRLATQIKHFSRAYPKPPPAWDKSKVASFFARPDRKLERYTRAVSIARHILQDERGDIRSGESDGLALVFDMNTLFEEYLYRQLLEWKPKAVQIERQHSRIFWGRNRLRPDLVLRSPQGSWVLDTKWRLLHNKQPSAEELRQIYVYCDYFKADGGVLVFPHHDPKQENQTERFSPIPDGQRKDRSCTIYFSRVVLDNGQLNKALGKEIFDDLKL